MPGARWPVLAIVCSTVVLSCCGPEKAARKSVDPAPPPGTARVMLVLTDCRSDDRADVCTGTVTTVTSYGPSTPVLPDGAEVSFRVSDRTLPSGRTLPDCSAIAAELRWSPAGRDPSTQPARWDALSLRCE